MRTPREEALAVLGEAWGGEIWKGDVGDVDILTNAIEAARADGAVAVARALSGLSGDAAPNRAVAIAATVLGVSLPAEMAARGRR